MTTSKSKLPDFDQLWDYDKPEETEQRFRAVLPVAENSGDRPYLAELLTQIARAQGLQRHWIPAHQTLDAAYSLLQENRQRARVRYLLERGRVFNSSGNRPQARELFLQAWQLALEQEQDFYAVDAAHMLGIAEAPDQQLVWHCKALEHAQASPDPRTQEWQGSLCNNIGWTYHASGHYEEALAYFHQALEFREKQGQAKHVRIATWCVARALRSLGRLDEALAMQRDLHAQGERTGEADGFVQEELGECLLALGDAHQAQPHFARAHAILAQGPWLAEQEPERLKRLASLAEQPVEPDTSTTDHAE